MSKKTLIILVAIIVVLGGTVAGILLTKDNTENKVITTPKVENNLPVEKPSEQVEESKDNEENTNNIVSQATSDKKEDNNEKNNFSDSTVKKTIQNYLDLKGIIAGSKEGLLVRLGLMSYGDFNEQDGNYIKTNIKYSDYKNKMLNYVTEDWFEKSFNNSYQNRDGYIYYFNGGASGLEFEVADVRIKGKYSNVSYIADVYNVNMDGTKEFEYHEFHIANYKGNCVISFCDF